MTSRNIKYEYLFVGAIASNGMRVCAGFALLNFN